MTDSIENHGVAVPEPAKLSPETSHSYDKYGETSGYDGDPEKSGELEPPVRRQPFGAVWIVIACGFALMSDGTPSSTN